LFLIFGAFQGYKAGSKVSLIAGLNSGICVLVGVWMAGVNPELGFGFLSLVTALLAVMFTVRLIKTKKFMPSGMLLIVTVVALVTAVLSFLGKV
jgi:uncharacterized membrane protein (UPF0136 family)